MKRKIGVMDGNTAAAYITYAFTEVATIYPTTATVPLLDSVVKNAENKIENIFGNTVEIIEMQSCAGAAGTLHGALNAGTLTNSFASGDGLLLMIPDMYKIAGGLLPAVIEVPTGTVSTHAFSKSGDHSDVMACRQTGFAMLAETNVQEIMDLAPVAHLAAIKGRVPFINFFDGFRTSHEIQKVAVWDYEDLKDMVDMDAVEAFRARALNPNHPTMRGSHENGDIYFQNREASNKYYDALPAIVEEYMDKINDKLGTDYQLFNYYGAPDADRVIIAMGSICDVVEEAIDYLIAQGEKVGLVKVRLYRPFCSGKLVAVIPETAKKISILDRQKEPGSQGEPLYLDVVTALYSEGRFGIEFSGGRYGLGSKNTTISDIISVFEEQKKEEGKKNFTIGIKDSLTNLSLVPPDIKSLSNNTFDVEIWGSYADGSLEAFKSSVNIIADNTDKYIQANIKKDDKKTGGIEISYLRCSDLKIRSAYDITCADVVICQNQYLIEKAYDVIKHLQTGGKFLVNSTWTDEELIDKLDAGIKKQLVDKKIKLFSINASDIARNSGMGKKTDTVLQAAFFGLTEIMPINKAVDCLKDMIIKDNQDKSQDIIKLNIDAIEAGIKGFHEIQISAEAINSNVNLQSKEIDNLLQTAILKLNGDELDVSDFENYADGTFDTGNSKIEKRAVATMVPSWEKSKCLQCNNCVFSCPHSALRSFMITPEESQSAPEYAKIVRVKSGRGKGIYEYSMCVSPLDCMGCGICVGSCPAHALEMQPIDSQLNQQNVFEYMTTLPEKKEIFDFTTRFSQYKAPMLEFANSCAGCAQTSYARIVTQLFGEYMIISNANGCSSRWGGPAAFSPYSKNEEGKGPAWANSHCEDNAEHGFGMYLAQKKLRDDLRIKLDNLKIPDLEFNRTLMQWKKTYSNGRENQSATKDLVDALKKIESNEAFDILRQKDYLNKKSVWIFGGDGWANDAGFGGLDHVIASGEDVNILVFNTECHSDFFGEKTKSSNIGYTKSRGLNIKTTKAKALAEMAMTYEYVYVAQVAMGADRGQTLKAIAEAEAYNGPSLIIAYAPCEAHLIKGGMKGSQREMDRAVKSGYWELFRFDPDAEGCKLTIDSKEPIKEYVQFLEGEGRYLKLKTYNVNEAEIMYKDSQCESERRRKHLEGMKEVYDEDVFELF